IKNLGGISRFVSMGETILLKPNMLCPRRPEKAVTTHPEVVRAMIQIVREAGAAPLVGDSPAGRSDEKILRHLAKATGIGPVCDQEGVEFVLFTDSERVPCPEGRAEKSFELTPYMSKVDGVISLPKLKTHALTGLTCAVKNLYGMIPGGSAKGGLHMKHKSSRSFSEMLVDLAECARPRLTVTDAVVGMDGEGPSAGRVKDIGLVIASDSTHAMDAFVADLVGAKRSSVPTVQIAMERGFVSEDKSGIEIVGEVDADFSIEGFKMPVPPTALNMGRALIGDTARNALARRPVFVKSRCNMCGSCIEACPGGALRKGTRKHVIARDMCIECYCCSEVCPSGAVTLRCVPLRYLSWKARGRIGSSARDER
ncbi:MAG: DUF362 domain-containing protein, partial [Thermoplasmata archaeon]